MSNAFDAFAGILLGLVLGLELVFEADGSRQRVDAGVEWVLPRRGIGRGRLMIIGAERSRGGRGGGGERTVVVVVAAAVEPGRRTHGVHVGGVGPVAG